MRVLVTGSRHARDQQFVSIHMSRLHAEHGFTVVIHGAAAGVDTLADNWAEANGIATEPYEVTQEEWDRIGRPAGPIRNKRMLVEGKPDLVVAFPGGPGTANMTKQAEEAGLKVIRIKHAESDQGRRPSDPIRDNHVDT